MFMIQMTPINPTLKKHRNHLKNENIKSNKPKTGRTGNRPKKK